MELLLLPTEEDPQVLLLWIRAVFTDTLKKILELKNQYLYVARRTFTNLFLGVSFLNVLRAVPDLAQLSLENIYL
jgi:hypothetical protein